MGMYFRERIVVDRNAERVGRVGWTAVLAGLLMLFIPCCAACGDSKQEEKGGGAEGEGVNSSEVTEDDVVGNGDGDRVVAFLDKLESRGKKILSYQANIVYMSEQCLLDTKIVRTGKIYYVSGDKARFAVLFDRRAVDNEMRYVRHDIIFDGTWLVEKRFEDKVFLKRQIVAPGEKFDPLELGAGPFPLPLGQKREQVLGMFKGSIIDDEIGEANDVNESRTGSGSLRGSVHLRLVPRVNEATGKALSELEQVDIWYDAEALLPLKIVTLDDATDVTMVILREAKVNELDDKQMEKMFDTTPPDRGWEVAIEPWRGDEG